MFSCHIFIIVITFQRIEQISRHDHIETAAALYAGEKGKEFFEPAHGKALHFSGKVRQMFCQLFKIHIHITGNGDDLIFSPCK